MTNDDLNVYQAYYDLYQTTMYNEYIAQEAWKPFNKLIRKVQTSNIGLKKDRKAADKFWNDKYHESVKNPSIANCDACITKLQKQSNMIQRKINGKEISDKKELYKIKAVYDQYIKLYESLKEELMKKQGKSSTESFISFCDDMII